MRWHKPQVKGHLNNILIMRWHKPQVKGHLNNILIMHWHKAAGKVIKSQTGKGSLKLNVNYVQGLIFSLSACGTVTWTMEWNYALYMNRTYRI